MYVHWKSLIGYGFVFWILLCTTDLLSDYRYAQSYDYVENTVKLENVEETKNDRIKMGLKLIIWNIITFAVSFGVCSFSKTIYWNIWKIYKSYKNQEKISIYTKKVIGRSMNSKIPLPVEKSPSLHSYIPEENVVLLTLSESSCPNLVTARSAKSYKKGRPVHKNNSVTDIQPLTSDCCSKLRAEILQIQSNSLKEHALLSRQLDSLTRDKRELAKQLILSQKENRAARQQLEETLNEKMLMHQRLESATKEFKNNTRTKKLALAKLEEVTCNVDTLRMQLEQVSRDKEILEHKLKILEEEYMQLQDRVVTFQKSNEVKLEQITPEKDDNTDRVLESDISPTSNDESDVGFMNLSVSQTELDMQKVQMKINRLEENLKNYNPKASMQVSNLDDKSGDESWKSEGSSQKDDDVYNDDNYEDEADLEDDNESRVKISDEYTETPESNCGSIKGDWKKFKENHIRNDPIYKINYLTSRLQENSKAIMENMHEASESCTNSMDELDEYDSYRGPRKIVSGSLAFQKFLKNLQSDSPKSCFSLI